MIRVYSKSREFVELKSFEEFSPLLQNAIWIDLHNPKKEELTDIQSAFGIALPTKEEMYGLEISNRLYQENGNFFLTIFIIVGADTPDPGIEPITFVIVGDKLITLRYVDPQPFKEFISCKERITMVNLDGKDVMFNLLENISERIADIFEKYGHAIDDLNKKVFKPNILVALEKHGINYEKVLKDIGHYGDIVAKSRESLASMSQLVVYLHKNGNFKRDHEETYSLDILESDIKALTEHAKFNASKINFLLEATLGMISIQQNSIIKIFTVATMMFLPPTLIASIYGMNFEFLPELHLKHGYYLALLLMILSAYIPYKYFKKKGWL